MLNIKTKYIFSIFVYLLVNLLFYACKENKPVVEPQIPEIIGLSDNQVYINDKLTIYGKNFGLASQKSRLVLERDGFNPQTDTLISLDSDLCGKWTYTAIEFKVPKDFVSGYIGVSVNSFSSNKVHIIVDKLPDLELIEIPPGSFAMGSENGWNNEQPLHTVSISNKFYCSKYEISQNLWIKVMNENPSIYIGKNIPVHNISWYDALRFCNKLSIINALDTCYVFLNDSMIIWNRKANGYRLPTEAEWEYACRAGSDSDFPFAKNINEVAWYSENSAYTPHPSGMKKANGFGIYDMQGNVWEWCWDWFDYTFYYYSPSKDPIGPGIGIKRVLRGGAANSGKAFIRASNRTFTDSNYNYCGIRVVRSKL